jgi:hypothetical protein
LNHQSLNNLDKIFAKSDKTCFQRFRISVNLLSMLSIRLVSATPSASVSSIIERLSEHKIKKTKKFCWNDCDCHKRSSLKLKILYENSMGRNRWFCGILKKSSILCLHSSFSITKMRTTCGWIVGTLFSN